MNKIQPAGKRGCCNTTQSVCSQFVGLHGNYDTDGRHCQTPREDYPRICSEVYGSRTATVTDLEASYFSGHECCLCGFTDTTVKFFMQGTPGYCFNKVRGWYNGTACTGCTERSSVYCVHDSGNVTFISRIPLIARFMGPTRGPSGVDNTQVGPMLAPWTLLSVTPC